MQSVMRKRLIGALRLESGLLLIGVALLSVTAYLLATMDQRARATERIKQTDYGEDYYRFAGVMAEAFLQIQEKYVEEVAPKDLFEGALAGLFDALDPHSGYLGADNFKELEKNTEGEFSGIGIHIDVRDDVLTVISPIPGTPAARAGIRAWDRIIKIGEDSTEGMTTRDAVKRLTGPVGSSVGFVVYRESERRRIPFTVIRDRIVIENVYSNVDDGERVTPYFEHLLAERIGYARVTSFSENVSERLAKVFERMKDKEVEGLILDVRWNSGGLLTEGIKVSDLFLDEGKLIVATKGRLAEQNEEYRAKTSRKVDWPIVMLVNRGSASATEILAGALKDHKRAVLIGPEGENTYGKALVQTIAPLVASFEQDKDGNDLPNAIRLTTAKYYSPSNVGPEGKSIDGVGIEPDLTVKLSLQHTSDLLMKGMLLGDPSQEKPPELREEAKNENGDTSATAQGAERNGASDMELAVEREGLFYLKKKDERKAPETEDIQLRYGVDVLRALLIADNGKK